MRARQREYSVPSSDHSFWSQTNRTKSTESILNIQRFLVPVPPSIRTPRDVNKNVRRTMTAREYISAFIELRHRLRHVNRLAILVNNVVNP